MPEKALLTRNSGMSPTPTMSRFSLRLPSTAANLGPGFDTLGIALTLYNEFHVRVAENGAHSVRVQGFGEHSLASPDNNLFFEAYIKTCKHHDWHVFPLSVTAENRIPLQGGMGSSATAVVGGTATAHLIHTGKLDRDAIMTDALLLETHPDNIGPCIYGGFAVSVLTDNGFIVDSTPINYPLCCWLIHPHKEVSTVESRLRVPNEWKRADTIYSLSRATLLVSALIKGRVQYLSECMKDRLHEPVRMDPHMEYPSLKALLTGPEFYGWAVSGSGPSVIAFCAKVTDRLRTTLDTYFKMKNVTYTAYELNVDNSGLTAVA